MGIEQTYKSYYDSIIAGKSYMDTRASVRYAISDYLAHLFFGIDFTRVIYTNPEYAFRKRLETLANGIETINGGIQYTDLQLPFASYNFISEPKIIKSVSASEWVGYYDETLEDYLHFMNVEMQAKVQLFFYGANDLAVAHRIALTESHSKFPVKYLQDIYWRNKTLKLPVFITIDNIKTSNDFGKNETQWLSENHMQAMVLTLKIETCQCHVHRGLNAVPLPYKWKETTINKDTWEDGQPEYYTQKAVLAFTEKLLGFKNCYTPEATLNEVAIRQAELLSGLQYKDCDEKTFKQIASVIPSTMAVEMLEGLFNQPVQVQFNRLKYNADKTVVDPKTGKVDVYIDFITKPATNQYWYRTDIIIPGHQAIYVTDCHVNHVILPDMFPNSEYEVMFVARDINGGFNTIPLKFTTPIWENETLPLATETGNAEDLNNHQINESEGLPEPQSVPLNGLIGMDDDFVGLEA